VKIFDLNCFEFVLGWGVWREEEGVFVFGAGPLKIYFCKTEGAGPPIPISFKNEIEENKETERSSVKDFRKP
jgi:hypothetical protein